MANTPLKWTVKGEELAVLERKHDGFKMTSVCKKEIPTILREFGGSVCAIGLCHLCTCVSLFQSSVT